MMAARTYSRRSVLRVAGGLAVASVVGMGCAEEPENSFDPLLELVDGPEAWRRLGADWLADEDQSRKAAEIIARLRADVGETKDPEALRLLLARRIEADYAASRMGRVNDWILSETEVALCALAGRRRRR